MPTCLRTYIPMYLHTYVPTYLRTYYINIHTFIPTYLRTYIPRYLCTYITMYLPRNLPMYLSKYVPTAASRLIAWRYKPQQKTDRTKWSSKIMALTYLFTYLLMYLHSDRKLMLEPQHRFWIVHTYNCVCPLVWRAYKKYHHSRADC
jgi:hypothetical protein